MSKPAGKMVEAPAEADTAAAAAMAAAETVAPSAAPQGAGEPLTVGTDFPCSAAQERFWLLDRLDPGNSSYNVAVRWRLEGRVATDLLERAWLKIIERHEVLRTVFPEVDGAPLQRVLPQARFRLNEIDLSNLAPEAQQTEGDRIGVMEARAPFDLAAGPLLRATCLRFSPMVSIILVTTHQIVSDGWSIGIMAREMGVIYDALRHGKAIELDELPIQYADYSEWHLEWLKVRGAEAETRYWSQQLAGIKPFKVLPDHPRPAMPTTNGAIASRVLPRELTQRAQALSAERGATLFATAFAALCATLARFTNETEIVVGTQVSGRDQVELEPMIGQFVNSLILRNDLSDDPTFGSLVGRVRDTLSEALEHKNIPIEVLLGMVKGERSDAHTPPISVNFIFQKTFIQNTAYTDFALTDMPSLPAGAIYDLNLFMVERPDGWRISCQYNIDQFDGATAERLLGYFHTLLESAVAKPSQRVSEFVLALPGAPSDEARALLARLNDTRTLYPRDLTLTQLFDAQAARSPVAVAVSCGDRQWTYAELKAAVDRLASYLHGQGVGQASRVGVCLTPCIELPLCLLAVLKTGARYVPLNAGDPPSRRAEVLHAAGATAVIGQGLSHAALGEATVKIIELETALSFGVDAVRALHSVPSWHSDAIACSLIDARGADAARVINLSHRNLTNLVFSLAKRPGINGRDVLVAASPVDTGPAIVELLLPLLTGACVAVAAERDLDGGRALGQLLQRSGATMVFGSGLLWNSLLDADWNGFATLKMLTAAADLNGRLIERLIGSGGALWSLYGVGGAGIWSAVRHVKSKESARVLGEPVANTGLYVLQSAHQSAAVGAVGELYVTGDGLTEHALTAAISSESGARLFPTGAVARLLSTGRIEYLGRRDDGFSHRGREISPLEIERALRRHPDVADAGVAYMDEAIEAFVVPLTVPGVREDDATLASELRALLAKLLPDYMQPHSIVLRDALPRTAQGLLDRNLLKVAKDRNNRGRLQAPPSGKIEEHLASLWQSMLHVDSIGAADNFFEMGGHSLLAARMLAKVEREFGRRIKLATLFLAPTLQEFAAVLSQNDPREFDFRQVVKIQATGTKRPLIVINNTGIYYGLAKNLGPEQPVYSLQLFDPSVQDAALPESLEEIAAGYVELIRRVQPEGPYDLMGWCVAGALAFEIARQLEEQQRSVSHLFLIDSWVPNYFKRLPALRGMIAGYSLRAQLILADLRRVTSSEKSLWAFVSERTLFKRLKRLFTRSTRAADESLSTGRATLQTYDQWLLAYLQRLTASYVPKRYRGRVTLLRSELEPTGWFFLEHAGWQEFVPNGIEVKFVAGNHFTMFQDPGSSQMAAHIVSSLGTAAIVPDPKT